MKHTIGYVGELNVELYRRISPLLFINGKFVDGVTVSSPWGSYGPYVVNLEMTVEDFEALMELTELRLWFKMTY